MKPDPDQDDDVDSIPRYARPPEPLMRSPDTWHGPPIRLERLPAEGCFGGAYMAEAHVAVSVSGRGRRWFGAGGRWRELSTTPAMVETYQAGFQLDRSRIQGEAGEVINIELPAAMVARMMPGEGRTFDLKTQHELCDPALEGIMRAMWLEAQAGSRRGALYTEGLTMALLGLLVQHRHAGSGEKKSLARVLSASQRNSVLEYIASEMASELNLERLAGAVNMSPYHFSRLFKATFNQSPHAFVIEQRLQAACGLLRGEAERSVADIAASVGFSSHSHFAEAFRRRIGVTPTAWRHMGALIPPVR